MSIEKISQDEIARFKKNEKIEKELPSAMNLIQSLAEPFLAEAEKLISKERPYIITEEGLLFPSDEKNIPPSVDIRTKKNLEILEKNTIKLNTLPGIDEYIKKAAKKGKTQDEAVKEYLDRLIKYSQAKKQLTGLDDASILRLAEDMKEELN